MARRGVALQAPSGRLCGVCWLTIRHADESRRAAGAQRQALRAEAMIGDVAAYVDVALQAPSGRLCGPLYAGTYIVSRCRSPAAVIDPTHGRAAGAQRQALQVGVAALIG